MKTIGKALGASVNDVLLSCVAGALREYLVDKGDATDGVMMRALVPVNLRPLEKAYKLGNQFGVVFLELPIGIENPVERLYAVRANMRALKGSFQPVLALGLLAAVGAGPKLLQDAAARRARAQCDRGDDQRAGSAAAALHRRRARSSASCSGCRSRATSAWACRSCRTTAQVQFGLITDRGLVPRSRARHRALRARIREARADDAAVRRGRATAISIRRDRGGGG